MFGEEEEIQYIGTFLLKMISLILLLISHILQCRISCWRPVSEGVTASLPCPAEFRGIAYDTSSQYELCSNLARFLKENCKYVFKLKVA